MFRHKKRWGQVFLKNKRIQERIAEYINLLDVKNLLEIGPGEGAITQYINHEFKKFSLVEIDSYLVGLLRKRYPNVNIILGDFLNLDLEDLFLERSGGLIFGNIPYYITSPILRKFSESKSFSQAVFMVQKEVFESITSLPKGRKYTPFTVFLQTISDIKRVLNVGKENFVPVPKVDSTVIHLTKKNTKILSYLDEYSYFLKKSFFMPRKKLVNNWKKFLSSEAIEEIFAEYNMDNSVRPDEISSDLYEKIFLGGVGKDYFQNLFQSLKF
ncbi:Ribosomal RNA small subunit methyltransferase A [Mycoplasma haemocanis str. Illinois]|uniref:Ribosomal RNA small subunit methyltransferase A n=1 Tax=Mycoplasma haemocanis (strain Illinois) TaxID=1111676 RepID=H6N8P7_MYCHN|nr:16S rRNA (adenine(1518)-N(6)/adenine(1519)-N(6))-dimethyltransferase RsmA [Mycoplasma haemocanis]AEW46019.1 Ribosomal RNA small subunit methyltransferase A [Mycoplasma haemocanis str. Illinois]